MSNNKILVLQGLPASGKTTHAEQLLRERNHYVRLSKASLHQMMFGDRSRIVKKDSEMTHYMRTMAFGILKSAGPKVLIADDCNLSQKDVDFWMEFQNHGFPVEFKSFKDVPLSTCLWRDGTRKNSVGRDIIYNMAFEYGIERSPNDCVVIDMDGTIATCEHRKSLLANGKLDWAHFLNPKNVIQDPPRYDVIQRIVQYQKDYETRTGRILDLIVVTARNESLRDVTRKWLSQHFPSHVSRVVMRNDGDFREDTIVKKEILDRFLDKIKILRAWDDRPCVIRMWRENGIEVEDVGDGVEF